MEISKRYNSAPVKDNCALCLPTAIYSGSGNLKVLFKFTPYPVAYLGFGKGGHGERAESDL